MIRRLLTDESGNIALLFALLLPMLLVGAALGVDSASLYLQRRQMQGALDLATMAAAADPARAFHIVHSELVAAGVVPSQISETALLKGTQGMQLVVETGQYIADPAIATSQRFSSGTTPANAVRAHLKDTGDLLFAQSWISPPDIGVSSVAAAEAEANFTVGSRLLRVAGGLPAAILGGVLGSGVTIDVMSYDHLLGAKVTLLGVFEGLRQEMSLGAVSYDQLFAANVTEGALARAIGSALQGLDRAAMMQIAARIGAGSRVDLGNLIDLGDWGAATIGTSAPGLGAAVSALDLLSIAAALSDGNHQVAVELAPTLPGLASLDARLTIGEPPQESGWLAIGELNKVVRTVQLRLQLNAVIGGGAALLNAGIRVPLSLEVASADARIKTLTCPNVASPNGSATIETRPSAARLSLGTVTPAAILDFGRPLPVSAARMVDVPLLLRISGRAQTDLGSSTTTMLPFSSSEIGAGTIKTAKSTGMVQSATRSLFDTLQLDVDVLGLGLLPSSLLATTLRAAIAPLTPVLDATIDAVLDVLGISLGEADVRVLEVRCSRPALVQ